MLTKKDYKIPIKGYFTHFRILKKNLNQDQIEALLSIDWKYSWNKKYYETEWDIWSRGEYIKGNPVIGSTNKDAGNIWKLFRELKISPDMIEWNYDRDYYMIETIDEEKNED